MWPFREKTTLKELCRVHHCRLPEPLERILDREEFVNVVYSMGNDVMWTLFRHPVRRREGASWSIGFLSESEEFEVVLGGDGTVSSVVFGGACYEQHAHISVVVSRLHGIPRRKE
jgi:hypothetical protein